MDRISFIVPIYNAEKYLEECINSLLLQTYENIEIILIDDASTDKSGIICDEYSSKDSRVKTIHTSHVGVAECRNIGIKEASGDWIAFADSDDYVDVTLCEKAMTEASENVVDIIAFGFCKVYPDGKTDKYIYEYEDKVFEKSDAINALCDEYFGSYVWNKIIKKECFEGILFPKGQVFEDLGTTYKIFEKANAICYLDSSLYYYRQHGNSIMHVMSMQKGYDQFQMRYAQASFFKEKYPKAYDGSLEGLIRSAVTYCLYFYDKREKPYAELYKKADEIVRTKRVVNQKEKAKIIVLRFIYKYMNPLFGMLSKIIVNRLER